MQLLLPYLRIKARSYYRLLKEIPVLVRLLLLGVVVGAGYVLFAYKEEPTVMIYLYCLVGFVLLGRWACRPSPKEEVLIKSLRLPVLKIQLFKYALLSVPFGMLNVGIGFFVLVAGSLLLIVLSRVRGFSGRVVPSGYRPNAYQWLSVWRGEGIWLCLAGIFLMGEGMANGNERLLHFAVIWTVCLPCLPAYYKRQDPVAFLAVYKNVAVLLKRKITELLFNSLLAVAVCLALIGLFSPSLLVASIWMAGGGLLVNLMLAYVYYISYPSILQAGISMLCITLVMVALFVDAPFYYWFSILPAFPILHFIAYQNLKSTLYATSKD